MKKIFLALILSASVSIAAAPTSFTFEVSNIGLLVDAICYNHGYTGLDSLGQPQTKGAFAKQTYSQILRDEVISYRIAQAEDTATATIRAAKNRSQLEIDIQ